MRVLLIEDNEDDALLIRETLTEAAGAPFTLEWADRLSAGLARLATGGFDVVLLDFGLPDSQGLETLSKVRDQAPEVPVVVMTGLADEMLAVEAVRAGAQDYLVKGQVTGHLLTRAARYAVERQRLLEELAQARQREREARELASLEQISRASQTSVTAQTFGVLLLRDSAPEFFATLAQRFEQLLDQALEQRVLRVEHNIEDELRNMQL